MYSQSTLKASIWSRLPAACALAVFSFSMFCAPIARAADDSEEDSLGRTNTSLMAWLAEQEDYSAISAHMDEFIQKRDRSELLADIDANLSTLSYALDFESNPQQALSFIELLAVKVPEYAQRSEFAFVKLQILLQLKQFDAARALILARWDEKDLALSCDPKRSGLGEMMSQWMGTNQGWLDEKGMLQVCAPSVRAWLESGKPPTVELPAIKALRVFDPRSQCAQVSFEMPNPLEAALLKGHMSAVELAKLRVRQAWPKLMEGCESYESQSSESLSAAYGQNILRNEYQSALASVSVQRPTSLLLFGDTLPLPSTECDFDQAPDCSKTKPLTTLSAQRIAQRLSKLNSNLTADIGQCTNTPEAERERLEALEKTLTSAVEKIMSKPAQTAAQRLAAIDKLLDNSLSGLGYELHQMLAKPLLQLAATEPKGAIAAQKKLIAALGMKAGETHWTQLARLQLTGRQADDAANSLKMALSLDYDSKTAAMLALLEAVQAGARPPFFQTPKRPWTHEVELFLLDEGQSDLDLVYLGALPNTVIEEFRVRQDWNRVLRAGAFAALDFDADEESENSGPAAKLALSGKWQGQSFQVGGWQLPWPDTFSVPEMEAISLSEQERAKLFAALGITVN